MRYVRKEALQEEKEILAQKEKDFQERLMLLDTSMFKVTKTPGMGSSTKDGKKEGFHAGNTIITP